MTLQLSVEPIKEFYGRMTDRMPELVSGMKDGEQVDIAREPAHLAFIYDQRVNGTEPFKTAFQSNYFFTADGAAKDIAGNQKIVLSASALRDVNPQSELSRGTLMISEEAYEAFSGQGVLTLTREEVASLHGKGYVRKEGSDLFVPKSDMVEKVHEHLSRGRINLADYAGEVAENTSSRFGNKVNQVMTFYFDQSDQDSYFVRPVVVDRTVNVSSVNADDDLGNYDGRLAGVAPEALDAFDNVGIKAPSAIETAQIVLGHLRGIDHTKGVTKKGLEEALRRSRF